MAGHEELLQSSEFQNHLSVQLAFRCLAMKLQQYVDIAMKSIHQEIYTKCSKYQPCQHNCSATYSGTHGWCEACKAWKNQILEHVRLSRRSKIHWDKMCSLKWPLDFRTLGKIFANVQWEEEKLNDVPSCLAILESCKDFKLSTSVSNQIREIRNNRNNYIGHNASLEVTDGDRARIFAILEQFATDFFQAVDALPLIQTFQNIENGNIFQSNNELAKRRQNIEEQIQLARSQEDTNGRLQVLSEYVTILENDIYESSIIPYRKIVANIGSDRKFGLTMIWIYIIMVLLLAFLFPRTGKDVMTGK
ncbi:hypothetical protein ACJMK2_002153 [Sinanodonta woodiana]|uniref:HEPN AbiU2-like domain-containing protein n=1 Tax=Sinanodonta woodiana TaxID=1069815 RepID=A0ABD3XW16_SINWO